MLCKSEPTKSEKAKGAALAVAGLAAEKAVEAKVKTEKDVVPTLVEKAEEARDVIVEKLEEARDAAAPHVEAATEKVADKTADQREAVAEKAGAAKAATVASLAAVADSAKDARDDAQKKGKKAAKKADKNSSRFMKKADKKTSKASKKADKKAEALAALLAAKAAKGEKKAVSAFGPGAREDVAYKAAALRGRAEAVAEDKGISADNARDFYKDELLPHLKEILATAAAAGTAASHNVVGQLPEGAQKQVAQYAPALAPKKKKGGFLITLGVAALAGAGYLVYADQQKKRAADARLSEAAIADSKTARGDEMTINNPVTNFAKADDTTMVRPAGVDTPTAEPAGAPGTAATWTDAEASGHMTTEGLEDPSAGETRSSRRAARDDH